MAAYGCIGLAGGILPEIPVKPKKLPQFSRQVTRHATALTDTKTTPIPATYEKIYDTVTDYGQSRMRKS